MKKFLSILGTGNYSRTKYYWKTKDNSIETHFIQEATLKLLCHDFTNNDKVLIFVTKDSHKSNWLEKPEGKDYLGLEGVLKNYTFEVQRIQIPDGKNEEEIWNIFQIMYDSINENDELYVDITHSFRSIPMLLLVLLNYLKVLKNVTVKSLTYGNWEGRDAGNYSPIVDLLPLVELQDWTIAANNFIKYGNVQMLVDLTNKEINPILKESKGKNQTASDLRELSKKLLSFSQSLSTVRGRDIFEIGKISDIKELLNKVKQNDNLISQLKPIIDNIEMKISEFDKDAIKNLFLAAKWCYQHEMYQQAYSFLLEGFITKVCLENELNCTDISERTLVTSAIKILNEKMEEHKWNDACKNQKDKLKKILEYLKRFDDALLSNLSSINELRNDFMHAGFRPNQVDSKNLIKKLDTFINEYVTQLL